MSVGSPQWSADEFESQPLRGGSPRLKILLVCAALLALIVTAWVAPWHDGDSATAVDPRNIMFFNKSDEEKRDPRFLSLWWEGFPEGLQEVAVGPPVTSASNIHPKDYAGPDACRKCHRQNYDDWSQHPHRWMNANADELTVKGDFSGQAEISYMGGKATFYRKNGEYRMRVARQQKREYVINQTIGSRFFQYYIGKQISGPDPKYDECYHQDHVLPFGFWLEPGEWVPIVHVGGEYPDGGRDDPFAPNSIMVYSDSCDVCHTTFPLADLLCRNTKRLARDVPVNLHWSTANYLDQAHPDLMAEVPDRNDFTEPEITDLLKKMLEYKAPEYAVTQGVSCEACHLGSQQHVDSPDQLPRFFPYSPHLLSEPETPEIDYGRTHENVNWACGRCHTGERPYFAAGMSTWNSTEYSDAMRGSCYSQLKCIDCHNPHKGIGQKWSLTPTQDDANCLRCHQQFEPATARREHTHHAPDSAGSRCLNCHMPRINEGMQDVVRTHTIFSPTQPEMLQANQPNACNLCHLDKPIDWTLDHLTEWYGEGSTGESISHAYPDRHGAVGTGWLKSSNESVRLVAVDALTRENSRWALPELLEALDDEFLLNRQFARIGLERMLDVRLSDYGYQFYMSPKERREPLERIRQALLAEQPAAGTTSAQRPE